jgi:hypothetical protein
LHGYSAAAAYNFNKYIGIEASASGHNGTTTVYAETPTATSTGYLETLSQDVYVFTFGPKLTLPVKDFSLFSHFLVGLNHVHDGFTEKCLPATGSAGSCGNSYYSTRGGGNGMAAKFGGGVEWNHGRFGIRILEVDYIYGQVSGTQYYNSSGTPYQEFRSGTGGGFELATGLTIHFGGK